jgi:hypothetical protein
MVAHMGEAAWDQRWNGSRGGMTLEALPALCDRLRVLQRDAPRQFAEADAISDGMLRLVVNISAALTAIDAQTVATASVLGDWALVVDDNLQITLAVFTADRRSAAAMLSPVAAIRLAGQLISAACRCL